ncbi:MAG: hypothetical protein QOK43_2492 [Acidimicrobiaceae bacterium]|nr:hypothetical protein [Acidimicrobiaceae bacterium]
MNRRDALVLRAFVVWTVYVWVTRLWNIWRDSSRDVGFKAVHTVLAVISVAFAAAAWGIVRRNRRHDRHGNDRHEEEAR